MEFGILIHADRDVFIGNFIKGNTYDSGIYHYSGETIYDGEWNVDQQHGA